MSREHVQILLVEDNPGDARLVREALKDGSSIPFELEHVGRLDEGLRRAAAGSTDVVLLDLSLPDAQGIATVERAHAAIPDVPIVVLTGLSDEAVAVEAVRAGAQDYLLKGQLDGGSLVRCMRYAIERQRMLAELDRVRQQQLLLKDRLLSHVSHELRTPLNAVYGFVTILLDGLAGEVTADQRECLSIALTNVQQLRSMIGDLLDATRAESGKLVIDQRRTSIRELIEETVTSLRTAAEAKGVTLSAETPDDLPPAHADPQRVRQILTNLVDNAIKFTPAAGAVTVRAGVEAAEPGFLRVMVADTGDGVSPAARQRIFERLYQDPSSADGTMKGLGLGLYICKALVSGHGGRLWLDGDEGKGSRFFFTLPLA